MCCMACNNNTTMSRSSLLFVWGSNMWVLHFSQFFAIHPNPPAHPILVVSAILHLQHEDTPHPTRHHNGVLSISHGSLSTT